MEATTRLMYTWELIDEANKLDDSNEMKLLILKSLGVSQKHNKPGGFFGARSMDRLPITALMHRSNAQIMLENLDNEELKKTFKTIYENYMEGVVL